MKNTKQVWRVRASNCHSGLTTGHGPTMSQTSPCRAFVDEERVVSVVSVAYTLYDVSKITNPRKISVIEIQLCKESAKPHQTPRCLCVGSQVEGISLSSTQRRIQEFDFVWTRPAVRYLCSVAAIEGRIFSTCSTPVDDPSNCPSWSRVITMNILFANLTVGYYMVYSHLLTSFMTINEDQRTLSFAKECTNQSKSINCQS